MSTSDHLDRGQGTEWHVSVLENATMISGARHQKWFRLSKRSTSPTINTDRILSPVRLPYSWYWKHVAVMLKGLDFKAITMPPICVYLGRIGLISQCCSHFVPKSASRCA